MRRKRHLSKWERYYTEKSMTTYFLNHYFKKENFHDSVAYIQMIDEYRGVISFHSVQFDLRGWKKGKSEF
jgi:hypothetical protein